MDYENLSGAQRGFRQAGKKLAPRDSYDAMMADQHKMNSRERRKAYAAEFNGYKKPMFGEDGNPSRAELKVWKTREALSSRRAKLVDRIHRELRTQDFNKPLYEAAFLMLGHAQWRYFQALEGHFAAEEAEYIDAQMLRNAI